MVLASLIVSTVMDAVVIMRVMMQTVDNQGIWGESGGLLGVMLISDGRGKIPYALGILPFRIG